ncbi:Os01g0721100 [Oryza sativa Japonica Group]|uniref:Os01g0721100 protein n=1 Tax=Oryza sativa subsp. japonica TaxID=39947 RepID=A0A0P0V7I3_ORYSJ|nr:Os01g0721100 [Oryza sativa Japonica Group]
MDTIFSAVLGDLFSRSISFVIDIYHHHHQGGVEENLQQLHRMLLRIKAVVEEADSRCITNQAMLLQLRMLRDVMFRGYYFVDNFRYRIFQAQAKDEVGDHSLDLPPFNPLERFFIFTRASKIASEILEKKELQKDAWSPGNHCFRHARVCCACEQLPSYNSPTLLQLCVAGKLHVWSSCRTGKGHQVLARTTSSLWCKRY